VLTGREHDARVAVDGVRRSSTRCANNAWRRAPDGALHVWDNPLMAISIVSFV
jgi:hypothetical protein